MSGSYNQDKQEADIPIDVWLAGRSYDVCRHLLVQTGMEGQLTVAAPVDN